MRGIGVAKSGRPMPLLKIAPRPGVFTDGTRYSAEGTWFDSDKVRFRKGFVEKIGGWINYTSGKIFGVGRKIFNWATGTGEIYIGVGTNNKLYVNNTIGYYDITPTRSTASISSNQITTTDGSGLVVVSHTNHGAKRGDFVTFSSISGAVNGIPAATLNTEHYIAYLGDLAGTDENNKYVVLVDDFATSTGAAGSSFTATYEINSGPIDAASLTAWGTGTWGSGPWGSTLSTPEEKIRLWSMDSFGDDLLANNRANKVYYWDESAGTSTAAVPLADLTRASVTLGTDPITTTSGSPTVEIYDDAGHGLAVGDSVTIAGAPSVGGISIDGTYDVASIVTFSVFTITFGSNASSTATGGGTGITATYKAGTHYPPTKCLQVMTSEIAKHVICFGCNPIGSSTIDLNLVRWSSSEDATDWQPLSTNSAGGQELSLGSTIIGALKARGEILIWTDAGLVSMRYTGDPFYFAFSTVGVGMSMISPNAAASANGVTFFMDRGAFYRYTGTVQRLTCPVLSTVFDDFNFDQDYKVVAGTNVDLSEVFWFYPSTSSSGRNDRYVVYNYDEDVWYFGTMARGDWDNAFLINNPLATSINTKSLGANPFATSSGSSSVTVTDTAHGLSTNDKVIFKAFSEFGGFHEKGINNMHPVTVTGVNTYTLEMGSNATSTESAAGGSGTVIYPNVLYRQESGWNDVDSAFTSYIETGDIDLGEGDQFMLLNRIIPDIKFLNASSDDEVTVTINGHDYPQEAQAELAASSFTPTASQSEIRGRSRQASVKVSSAGAGYGWRVGYIRVDARTDGRR